MFYKHRALVFTKKVTIAKFYGIKPHQLLERHYECWYKKFILKKYLGDFR